MQRHSEQELDRLFEDYRDAIPEVEPSPDFLARVWEKIEQNRAAGWLPFLRLWAPRVALAGGLAAALLTASVWIPAQQQRQEAVLEQSYVEALTVESLDEHDGALWIMAGDRLAAER